RLLSPGLGGESVNSKFGRRLNQRRAFAQMVDEFWIRLEPPKSVPRKNEMRGPATTQPLKILDCLLAVVRIAVVDRVVLQEMPTPPLRVVKDGRVTHVG